jgi:hypothetical protein
VIEPSFGALLMPAISQPSLPQAGLPPATQAAIALAAITAGAQEEHRAAFVSQAKPLPQNHFALCRHASSQAALDNGRGFVAG